MNDHCNIVERVMRHAQRRAGHPAFIFLRNGEQEQERIGYGELMRRVADVAAQLRQAGAPGGRVLLLYPQGIDFVIAFLACLAARVVAVPLPLPQPNDRTGRFAAVERDARAGWILSTARHGASLLPHFRDGLTLLATDDAPDAGGAGFEAAGIDPDAAAFLQYTSGSTGEPKGVVVTHRNLAHNQQMIAQAFGAGEETVCVSWIPSYHDMGLIGSILGTLYAGGTCVLMPPLSFVQKPLRWLRAIAAYRASTSGAPNFAYDLCLRKVADEDLAQLDLSSWRLAFCGAEPVRCETLARFGARFAAAGFDPGAFYPCYGMAEATLFVTGPASGAGLQAGRYERAALAAGRAVPAGPATPQNQVMLLAGCGLPWGRQEVHIVDPERGVPCAAHEVGEIWVCGDSVAAGYWDNPDATREAFHATLPGRAQRFLRTGDLGFIDGGHLYIAGRLKDAIILHGRNHAPQDIEASAGGSHPAFRDAACAAFAVPGPNGERLVVAQEVERRYLNMIDADDLQAAIRTVLARSHGVQAADIVLLPPAALPRTSSGKLRRAECRQRYLSGALRRLDA